MAKTSMIEREKRRAKTVKKYAARRAKIKEQIRDPRASQEDRMAAIEALQKLPRDSSPSRARGRDSLVRRLALGHGDLQHLVLLGHGDAVADRQRQRALGAFHGHGVPGDRRGDALRELDRELCDSRHVLLPQATTQSTSPPCPERRASRSVMTPFGVETMATPRPPSTFGSSSLAR